MAQREQVKEVQITVKGEESYASPANLIPKIEKRSTTCASDLVSLPIWQRPFYEICLFVVWVIVGIVLLCCFLTCLTVVVVTLCLLSNTLLHVFESMRGEAGKNKLVSPISDKVATYMLLSAMAMLGVWVVIVQAVDNWKGRVVDPGIHIAQWIKIVMVILGYFTLGTIIRALVAAYRRKPLPPWLQGLLEAAYCVLLWPMVVLIMTVVPSWKHHKILGLLTWKWVRAAVLVVLGHSAITIAVKAGVAFSKLWCRYSGKGGCKGRKCVYFYLKGLRRSVNFMSVTVMHLMVWKLYFVRRITNKSWSDYGTWTFACELILGGLWLLKNFVLLYWLAHSIYDRPDEQTMRKHRYWYCLHHLGLIKWRGDQDQDQTADNNSEKLGALTQDQSQQESVADNKKSSVSSTDYSHRKTSSLCERYMFLPTYRFMKEKVFVDTRQKIEDASNWRREKIWNDAKNTLINVVEREHNRSSQDNQSVHKKELDTATSPKTTVATEKRTFFDKLKKDKQRQERIIPIHDKHRIAQAFDRRHRSLPSDKEFQEFTEQWKKYMLDQNRRSIKDVGELKEFIGAFNTEKSLDDTAAEVLYKQLQDTNKDTEKEVSVEDFLTWMDKARQNCLQLQYALVSAGGVLNFLNRLMIGFVITLVVILWLLFTEILPTKAVVVISSPFLAATFIFGDTIKTMFQGIVFAYIMHPFTVGDLCVIDGTQMEVKEIGVWRTTFSKVGTEEEVLIPNSVLKSKAIINCEGHPELVLHDVLEFSLDGATESRAIGELEKSIKRFVWQQPGWAQSKRVDGAAVKKIIQQNIPESSEGLPHPIKQVETKDIKQDDLTQTEIQEEHTQDMGRMHRTTSEPTGHYEVSDDRSLVRSVSEPIGHVVFEEQGSDDITMMVKQIEDSVKVVVHFKHRETINDMTRAQAYNAKCKWKSEILREVAKLIAISSKSGGKADVKAGYATKV